MKIAGMIVEMSITVFVENDESFREARSGRAKFVCNCPSAVNEAYLSKPMGASMKQDCAKQHQEPHQGLSCQVQRPFLSPLLPASSLQGSTSQQAKHNNQHYYYC